MVLSRREERHWNFSQCLKPNQTSAQEGRKGSSTGKGEQLRVVKREVNRQRKWSGLRSGRSTQNWRTWNAKHEERFESMV